MKVNYRLKLLVKTFSIIKMSAQSLKITIVDFEIKV